MFINEQKNVSKPNRFQEKTKGWSKQFFIQTQKIFKFSPLACI